MNRRRWVALLVLLTMTGTAVAEVFRVGSKAFTESVVLAEVVRLLCEKHGHRSQHRAELGGSVILFQALEKGDIDAYPEYTGTIATELLGGQAGKDEAGLRAALAKKGIGMTGRLGFSNTYALGMKRQRAEELKIRTISDLQKHPDLILGFSNEFVGRKDGWEGLQRRYQLRPRHPPQGSDHSAALSALGRKIDVTDLYSTDAEIRQYDLVVLEDDRGFFPAYDAVILYRLDLEQRNPELVALLKKLEDSLDNDTMTALNSRVQIDGASESLAAGEFLNKRFNLGIDLEALEREGQWQRRLERFGRNTYEHLYLVAVSLGLAVLVSVPLGVVAYKVPPLGRLVLGVVGVLQTLPSLALLVFMVPLLGLGPWPAIVALFLYSLLPIVRNTYTGLQDIPPPLRESALALGLPAWPRLRRVELPMASRSILAGIKIAAVINVGTATIGGLIGAGGYGEPILTGIRLNNVGMILQGAVPAAVLALLVEGLFGAAERVLVPRGLRLTAA
jgi:osmoprotectant transport system permease protein